MIRVISATNEKDHSLGSYFQDCYNNLKSCLIDTGNIDIHLNISADQCTHEFIDKELPEITNDLPFIFVVYSHGNKSAFRSNSGNYVDLNNLPKLSGSFVYSTACLAGRELGPSLILAGCKSFLGFQEESNAFENVAYRDINMSFPEYGLHF